MSSGMEHEKLKIDTYPRHLRAPINDWVLRIQDMADVVAQWGSARCCTEEGPERKANKGRNRTAVELGNADRDTPIGDFQ